MTKVLIAGCDHAGVTLKRELLVAAEALGWTTIDLGTQSEESTDFPDYAHAVALRVATGEGLGLLVCGTGIGMSMAANRHPGVRAALCGDVFSAKMTRLHNNANVLCIGSRVVGSGLAVEILTTFLASEFEGGRHARRVGKIETA